MHIKKKQNYTPEPLQPRQLYDVDFADAGLPERKKQVTRKQLRSTAALSLPMKERPKVNLTFKSINKGILNVQAKVITLGKEYMVVNGGTMVPVNSLLSITH